MDGLEILKEMPDLELCGNTSINFVPEIANLVNIIKNFTKDMTKSTIDFFNCFSTIFKNVQNLFSSCRKLPDEFTQMVVDLKNYFANPKQYFIDFFKNFALPFLNWDELYVRMKVYSEESMFKKLGLSCGKLIKEINLFINMYML